jgi:hypothetical protein
MPPPRAPRIPRRAALQFSRGELTISLNLRGAPCYRFYTNRKHGTSPERGPYASLARISDRCSPRSLSIVIPRGSSVIPLRYNLRSVFERRAISILTILGIGLVAVIFVILAGFIHGLQSTVIGASDNRNWIVLNRGAPDEDASVIVREELNVIESRPEIAGHGRTPLVSEEILLGMNISQGLRGK